MQMITIIIIYQIMQKKNAAEALQTMLQVNNATVEEQGTQMANFTIQNQESRTQLDNATAQLATL